MGQKCIFCKINRNKSGNIDGLWVKTIGFSSSQMIISQFNVDFSFNLFVWVDKSFYLCSRIIKKEEAMSTTITLLAMLDIRLRFVVGSVGCA